MKPIDLVDLAEAASSGSAANDSKSEKQKSDRALRTISEAADLLDVPQHVLRFWETKFTQIKPLKRNGGRRFYRPEDIETLQVIKTLLYKQGFTIKGARKALESDSVVVTMPEENTVYEESQAPVIGGRVASAEEQAQGELKSLRTRLAECKSLLAPFVASNS